MSKKLQPIDIEFDYAFENYIKQIILNKLLLPKIGCRYFTHVIELQEEDEQEIMLRCRDILEELIMK